MVRLLSCLAVALVLGSCSDLCQNTVISRGPSLDGRLEAVLFQRDCGATTDYSTHISIQRPVQMPSGGGSVFVADGGSAANPTTRGGPWAEAAWQGPRHLHVRYDDLSEVYKQKARVAGVDVTFEPVRR